MQSRKDKQPGLFEETSKVVQAELSAEMYSDGACSGNPGESGIGVVINITSPTNGSSELDSQYRISEYIGIATNNIAEYSALIKGLEKARSLGIKKLKVFLDSELVVKQMNGVYKVKHAKMIPLYNQARDIYKFFDSCKISHVRREFNAEADALAREGVSKGRM